jgi:hypothetical protein
MIDSDVDSRIRRAISTFNRSMLSRAAAKGFLREMDSPKDHTERLFAWLILFEDRPGDTDWLPARVAKLHADYQARIRDVLGGSDDPLFSLPATEQRTLKVDFVRTIHWFCSLVEPMKVTGLPLNDTVIRHAHRIFNGLYHTDKAHYSYFQGHDRFMFVAYILAVRFTCIADLPHDVAESLTFHLLAPILRLVDTDAIIRAADKDPALVNLGRVLQEREPNIADRLRQSKVETINYALRWRLLLFADEYGSTFDDIVNTWDAIFVRRKRLNQFFADLAFERLRQILLPSDPMMITQTIQRWPKWDTQKILRNAVAAFDTAVYGTYNLFAIRLAAIGFVFGAIAVAGSAMRK